MTNPNLEAAKDALNTILEIGIKDGMLNSENNSENDRNVVLFSLVATMGNAMIAQTVELQRMNSSLESIRAKLTAHLNVRIE